VSAWLYDTNNFLLQSVNAVNALNLTNSFTYNANGQPLTVTDPLGRAVTNAYDTAAKGVRDDYWHVKAALRGSAHPA
jgi:YD repeat-containing protein